MPDPADLLSPDHPVADPMKQEKSLPDQDSTTAQETLNEPPMLGNWNTPVSRPVISPEQQAKLDSLTKPKMLSPEEQLRELVQLRPTGFLEDSESVDSTNKQPDFIELPAEDPNIKAQMDYLGIVDSSEVTSPAMDPDVPLDHPTTNAEILNTVHATNEEISQRNTPLQVEEVQEMTVVAEETHTEEDIEVLQPFTVQPNEEAVVDISQSVESVKIETETPEVEDFPLESMSVSPEPTIEPSQKHKVEFKINPKPKDPEPEKEEPKEPVKEPVSEFQEALNDLPESVQSDVTDSDLETIENTEASLPEVNVSDGEEFDTDTEQETTARDALTGIGLLYSQQSFGDDTKAVFTPEDMDIVIPNDIDPQHYVLPNMAVEDVLQYMTQSNPDRLQRFARQVFGNDSELYDITTEGLNELRINLSQETSYPSRVHVSGQQYHSDQSQFSRGVLKEAESEFKQKFPGKEFKISRAVKLPPKEKDGKPIVIDDNYASKDVIFKKMEAGGVAKVNSASANKIAAMLINGLRSIRLYHSGFHVNLSAPKMDALSRYYTTCAERLSEFGRMFGQFAFLPIGVETRSALLDLFETCVQGSNLVDWDQNNNLRKAISVLDIPVIAWALATLMYPKGVDIEYLCYNQDETAGTRCRHVEKAKVDINTMRYNNWYRMTSDQVLYCISKEKRTLEDLAKYRAEFCGTDGTVLPISEDGAWKVTVYLPTAEEAENAQRTYIAEMADHVKLDQIVKAQTYFQTKYLASFAPYIKKVTYTDPDTNKTIVFENSVSLNPALDTIQAQGRNSNLSEVLTKYISDKSLTHIAFTHHACPKCGKLPPDAINGLSACDPEYAFFVWAAARLRQLVL